MVTLRIAKELIFIGGLMALATALDSGVAQAAAPDFTREAAHADEVVDAILDAVPEWL